MAEWLTEQAYCWCGHNEDAHDDARHGVMGGSDYEAPWCYACEDDRNFDTLPHTFKVAA